MIRRKTILATLGLLVAMPLAGLAEGPAPVTTFETGKSPAIEIHVSVTGSDATGDGSAGSPYRTIERGVQDAVAGTAVRVHPGIYQERVDVVDLSGTASAPIWIGGADPDDRPIIEGGSEGMHLTRVRYLIVHDLEVRDTQQNGINCDDGGDYANPDATRHIVFRDLYIHDVGGSGNQDGLKLSGLDDYFVIGCEMARCGGGNSGSGVDHVGCHGGVIANNDFHDLSANAVQCKGGSENIEIRGNRMRDFGQRSVNLGGSTGFQFFRPPLSTTTPNFEARNIRMIANVIEGGIASLAFVGCVDCVVVNNTVINPTNWLIRVLQETNSTAEYEFLSCSNNTVANNLFCFDRSDLASSSINIGAGTDANSFTYSHNLWFAHDNPGQSTPHPAPAQTGAIIGQDPKLKDLAGRDYRLLAGSPAAGAGDALLAPQFDFAGLRYRTPPSIGAHEMTAWEDWRQAYFPGAAQLENPSLSGPVGQPGMDGIPNLVKFAFSLNPWIDGPGELPFPVLEDGRLVFSWERFLDSEFSVVVAVEVSSNLVSWQSGEGETSLPSVIDLGGGTEWVRVEDLLETGGAGTRHMRARLTFLE